MQFAYNDEQQMLHDSALRFGSDEWNAADRLKRLAEVGEGSARRWAQMAELGWLMLPVAEEDGGLGHLAPTLRGTFANFRQPLQPLGGIPFLRTEAFGAVAQHLLLVVKGELHR